MRDLFPKMFACIVTVILLGLSSPSAEASLRTNTFIITAESGKLLGQKTVDGMGALSKSEPFSLNSHVSGSTLEPIPETTVAVVMEPIVDATPESSAAPTPESSTAPTPESSAAPTPESSAAPTPEINLSAKAVITAVGDIILHASVIRGGLQNDESYSYDYIFDDVSAIFEQSDYSIANFEGTLNGPPYSGYPMFAAPDAIATALKNAGLDMVTTANNHAFDRKLPGLIRTPRIFQQAGIDVVGTRSDANDPSFIVKDVNGIRIGITAYTWETIGSDKIRALNGINLPPEADALVDSFNPNVQTRFEQDMNAMDARIQAMKDAKAECIVFLMHWGDEYKTVSSPSQRVLAQYLADKGVDVIIGHHPHVLQEISVLSSITGKNTLVYYSLGNFLANMSFSTHGTSGNAEDAVIARIEIERDRTGKINVTKGEYLDTYVWKNIAGGKTVHSIVPVRLAIRLPDQFGTGRQTSLLTSSILRIEKIMGKSNGVWNGILIREWTGVSSGNPDVNLSHLQDNPFEIR